MSLKKNTELLILFILVLLLFTACGGGGNPSVTFQDGSSDYPYLIETAWDLRNIGIGSFELDKNYLLTGNILIDNNWEPIGSEENPFTGVFDGNGYTIGGDVNRSNSTAPYVGLFDYIGSEGVVKNIKWGAWINAGDSDYVGAIAGYNKGTIEKITFYGNVETTGNYVGSIAGFNEGQIIDTAHQGQVYGGDYVGGLVGVNEGLISIGFHIGEVGRNPAGEVKSNIAGGIAAINKGIIEKVSAINGTVYGKYSLGSVIDGGVGGIVGFNDGGEISECVSSITVNGKDNVGGMVGYSKDGKIRNSYCVNSNIGKVQVLGGETSYSNMGFFIGMAEDVIIENTYNQHSSDLVEAENSGHYIGSLVGDNNISNSYLLFYRPDPVVIGKIEGAQNPGIKVVASEDEAKIKGTYEGFVFDTDVTGESNEEAVWTFDDILQDWQDWWSYPKLISQVDKWLTHSDWRGIR